MCNYLTCYFAIKKIYDLVTLHSSALSQQALCDLLATPRSSATPEQWLMAHKHRLHCSEQLSSQELILSDHTDLVKLVFSTGLEEFLLSFSLSYVTCSKTIGIHLSDTLISRDENMTGEQGLPVLLTELFPGHGDKLLWKKEDERQRWKSKVLHSV